ncbi:MAG: ABC transporter permease [Chloroflexi bacterium HGW-Chloroflexi-8]|nr:MAG: ABC transporter permease [Chloroflexi bacterium HGW-Chloroflexi-8]
MKSDTVVSRKSIFPFRVKFEQRISDVPKWYPIALSFAAVVVALLIGAIVLAVGGGNPWATYAHIARASFGSVGVFSDTLVKATPLILVGLACTVAFRMKLWNIGAEGQFFVGAFGASAVVLIPLLPETAPNWLFIIAMMLAGMFCGAIFGLIPGLLKAIFNVNEVISTLMLNYIAVAWNNFFIFAIWTEGGFQMSKVFPKNAWLPRLTDLGSEYPFFRGLTTHFGLIIAIIAAVILWYILNRSKWGYEIRLIGDNPKAANYAGIPIKKHIVLVMVVSGALAGLAGMSEISGVVHRLQGAISPGYGFTGIIVAWLAKLNPIAVIFVSILFGALILAGREIQPSGVPKMIQGVILVCLIASDFLIRYRVKIIRNSEEE